MAITFFQAEGQKADSAKHDFRPSGIRVGTDVISLVRSFTNDPFSGWEVNGDINFYKYIMVVDVGHWERNETIDNGTYSNSGNYFRVGVDVNFLPRDPDGNVFFIGARYGHSKFDELASYAISNPVFGTSSNSFSNSALTAGWAEMTTGIKVNVGKGFWMGLTARMKFALTQFTPFQPYDIPGYGRTFKTPWWGFNYQVYYRIPLRKKRLLPK